MRTLRVRTFSIDSARSVLLDAVAREHANVDDRAVHAGRHAQRRVFHVGRFLTEDRAQQLLFRRQLGLALRRDLADEDVARLDLGTDERDARFVELRERGVTDVRDIRGDVFGPSFVSRATHCSSSMWIVVKRSSLTTRSEIRIESSKL